MTSFIVSVPLLLPLATAAVISGFYSSDHFSLRVVTSTGLQINLTDVFRARFSMSGTCTIPASINLNLGSPCHHPDDFYPPLMIQYHGHTVVCSAFLLSSCSFTQGWGDTVQKTGLSAEPCSLLALCSRLALGSTWIAFPLLAGPASS